MHVHTNIPYSLTMSSILLINNNILVTTYLSTNCHYLSLYSILMCFCWGEHPLQRKLYRKAKQEPTYRFYALYDKVFRADILSHAYTLVRANKGSAGIDGVTFEAIEEREGVSAFLAELQEALRSKTYQASPVKRVMIPKTDGTERPLGIPTIRDRVAQMAVKLVIEPIFEADFCECSYGFRPKKSAHDAVDDVAY